MGFWETITDLVDAATPWSVADAEAPSEVPKNDDTSADDSEETKSEDKESSSEEEPKEESEGGEESEEAGGEEESEEDDEEEEEEEEDDEPVDPKVELEEQCANSKQCAPAKHHYDECVERVTSQEANGGAKEDCVEEFFHLAHCATQCAAPKLWSVLK